MKKLNSILSVILVVAMCLLFTACGSDSSESNKKAAVFFDSGDEALKEPYSTAAKGYYSDCTSGSVSELGSGASDARYIYFVSSDKSVLDRDKVDGKNFTVLTYDDGKENLSVKILFLMGDGKDCIKKGNVVSGSVQASVTFDVNASTVTDPKERAGYLFKNAAKEIKDIEG